MDTCTPYIFLYLWANPFISLFQYTNNACYVNYTKQQCTVFPKIPKPWRDSNPGLLFLRRIRCPLRHDVKGLYVR
jgi:hypothetical protein